MKVFFKWMFVVLTSLGCLSAESNAQNISVDAKLDSTSIIMGDQTILHLSVQFPSGDSIDFPMLIDTLTKDVQIVSKSKIDTLVDKDDFKAATMSQQITITSFEAGSYVIPAFVFRTALDSFATDKIYLDVLPVKVDTSKAIYDIKQPFAIAYSWLDWLRDHWLWVVIPLVAAALIVGFIYYLRKRPKKQPVVEVPKPRIPSHQLALEKLDLLRKKQLLQREQIKQYHIELSDIIREYLENRYSLKAQEQTSAEIFKMVKYLDISDGDKSKLRQVLILADLVKFAKEKPLPTDNEQSMENAFDFVLHTQERAQLAENKEETQGNELV